MLSDLWESPSIMAANGRSLESVKIDGQDAIRAFLIRGENMEGKWGARTNPQACHAMFSLLDSEPWETVRTYEFGILIPESWRNTNARDLCFQTHNYPDPGEFASVGNLGLYVVGDQFEWRYNYNGAPVNVANVPLVGVLGSCYFAKNVPTDWKVEARFAWDETGYTKIWRNGQLFADYKGPNAFNDKRSPYASIGLYKFDWSDGVNSRFLYVMNWQVAYQ